MIDITWKFKKHIEGKKSIKLSDSKSKKILISGEKGT